MKERCIYLSGKIQVGAGSTYYRSYVAPMFQKAGFRTLDPLRGKGPTKVWGSYEPGEILQRDLSDLLRCKPDGVCFSVIMMEGKTVSFGTPCEVALAWANNIPVVFVTNNKALAEHYWVRAMSSRVFFVDSVDSEKIKAKITEAAQYTIDWFGSQDEGAPVDIGAEALKQLRSEVPQK